MDLKPALLKKLSDMQKSLEEADPDRGVLETLKKTVEKESDESVILQMVLFTNSLIENKPAHEEKTT